MGWTKAPVSSITPRRSASPSVAMPRSQSRSVTTWESVVRVAFESEGEYTDFVETVTVEMIRKDRSPFWVRLGEEKLEHFLNRRKFEAAEKGWYYSMTKKAVLVKYPNPKKNITLTVSFEDFDLIGM